MLDRLLRDEPTAEVIDAVSLVADDYCIVQLGRIARTNTVLSAAGRHAASGTFGGGPLPGHAADGKQTGSASCATTDSGTPIVPRMRRLNSR
jgi:hypothetical protein